MKNTKTEQLQIRISAAQKRAIKRAARQAGMGLSEFVLARALPPHSERFHAILKTLHSERASAYALAELNDFLSSLPQSAFEQAVGEKPDVSLRPEHWNRVAAMVELAAAQKKTKAPSWASRIGITPPEFASQLNNLRLHLLLDTPLALRRRNIFADSSLGDRI